MTTSISDFIKQKRKQLKLTQPDLAEKAGVGLRFVRELEQGKGRWHQPTPRGQGSHPSPRGSP